MIFRFSRVVLLGFWADLCLLSLGALAANCDYSDQSYYIIANQSDADAISTCSTIYGWISVNVTEDVKDITLKGVQRITGRLHFAAGSKLDTFLATDLVEIEQMLNVYGRGHKNMTFSSLTTVGSLSIGDTDNIETLSFPAGLSTWSENTNRFPDPGIVFVAGTNLEVLENIKFATMNGLSIQDNPRLHNLILDVESIGDLTSYQNVLISQNGGSLDPGNQTGRAFNLSLPHLTTLTGDSYLADLTALDMPNLLDINGTVSIERVHSTALDFPSLTAIFCDIDDNLVQPPSYLSISDSQLNSMDLSALTNASQLILTNNTGSLYDKFWLPNLVYANQIDLETESAGILGLNCSDWGQFTCNGTTAEVNCQTTNFYNNTDTDQLVGCQHKKSNSSYQHSVSLAVLFQLVGFGVIAGLL